MQVVTAEGPVKVQEPESHCDCWHERSEQGLVSQVSRSSSKPKARLEIRVRYVYGSKISAEPTTLPLASVPPAINTVLSGSWVAV